MERETLLLGVGTMLIGVIGLWRREWILTETPKGRFLMESIGADRARWWIVGFFLILLGMGVSLASGWLRPLRW